MVFQIITDLQKIFQYIYLKESTFKLTHAVQIHVAQGSTIF